MEEEFYLCENEEDILFIVNYLEYKMDVKYYTNKLSESKERFINLCNFYLGFKQNHTFYIFFKDGYLDFGFYRNDNISNSTLKQKMKSVKLMRRKIKLKQL